MLVCLFFFIFKNGFMYIPLPLNFSKQINTKPLAVSGCVGGTEAKQIAADSQVKPKSAGARQESDHARSPAACKPGARVFQTVRGRLPSVYSCSERGKCKDGNDKKASCRWFWLPAMIGTIRQKQHAVREQEAGTSTDRCSAGWTV